VAALSTTRRTGPVPAAQRLGVGSLAASLALASLVGCTSIDPGGDFTPPITAFDPDYFYCHVEPGFIFANKCGPGDPSKGDAANGCHFNASVVTGMALRDHPPVNCGGGDHPVDQTQVGTGGPAQSNFEAASLEMSRQYTTAPIFVRPSGSNHPRPIFASSDTTVNSLLATWASK
jgi:hypothetical protein